MKIEMLDRKHLACGNSLVAAVTLIPDSKAFPVLSGRGQGS